MKLTQRTVLITGGATGIGRALAEAFLSRGNTVIVCGRSQSTLDDAARGVDGLVTRRSDVSNDSDRRDLVAWLQANHPDLDLLINNAGVQFRPDFRQRIDEDAIAAEIGVNLTSPILLTAALLPHLRGKPRAAVMNVTSGLAFCPMAEMPIYCATKAAMHSFTMSLRHQLRETTVRVVEIAPPIVDTRLGGVTRGGEGQPPVVAPQHFAAEVMAQLAAGQEEVLFGMSAMTRREGDAFFGRMNQA